MNGNFKCPGVTPSSSCCVPQTKFDEKNRFLHSTVIETISFTQGLAYCSHFLHISCLPVTGIKSQDILQPPCDGNKVSGYTYFNLPLFVLQFRVPNHDLPPGAIVVIPKLSSHTIFVFLGVYIKFKG